MTDMDCDNRYPWLTATPTKTPKKVTCLTCGGAGIVELDNFYMVGPSAREQECRDCFGRGWRVTP